MIGRKGLAVAHRTVRSEYQQLTDRLNRFPQGAPPSDPLYKILSMLFSEREAGLVAQLPMQPFTATRASRVWKLPLAETRRHPRRTGEPRHPARHRAPDGERMFVLPPPMAGFFEFSMMRIRGDVDQKVLGELFYQYLNVEEEFIQALFADGRDAAGPGLRAGAALLERQRAARARLRAGQRGHPHRLAPRPSASATAGTRCSTSAGHCDAPMDICMTFNALGLFADRHGYAREVDVAEGLDLLAEAYEREPRPVRRERARERQLHLQLLRLLLRGDDRRPQVRDA